MRCLKNSLKNMEIDSFLKPFPRFLVNFFGECENLNSKFALEREI